MSLRRHSDQVKESKKDLPEEVMELGFSLNDHGHWNIPLLLKKLFIYVPWSDFTKHFSFKLALVKVGLFHLIFSRASIVLFKRFLGLRLVPSSESFFGLYSYLRRIEVVVEHLELGCE
jgi:hypothetical protein